MVKKTSEQRQAVLLVLRAQSGDRVATDQLLQMFQSPLLGYLVKMLGNSADAEDALQTTLIQAVAKLRWLRNPELFRPWLFRIASRVAYRLLKTQKRWHKLHEAKTIEQLAEPIPDDAKYDPELVENIPRWLDSLTPNGREVLLLHYIEGFTAQQVADILQIPLGTAKSRISYALTCIRKQIPEKGTPNE